MPKIMRFFLIWFFLVMGPIMGLVSYGYYQDGNVICAGLAAGFSGCCPCIAWIVWA